MEGRKGTTMAVLAVLLGVALVLLSACGGGASAKDYNAVKLQLEATEQEAAAAKQQVASFQQQLETAASREPKRLEAKITIVAGETTSGMFFASPEGEKGPFRIPAGKTVGIRLVNRSLAEEHEAMFGRTLNIEQGIAHGYKVNLFEKIPADVFIYPAGKKIEVATRGGIEELELEADGSLWIRATFPQEMKGEWEIGCFIQETGEKSHYEQGMKAKLIIE